MDGIAGLIFIVELQGVFVELLHRDLDIGKDSIPADMEQVDQLLDIDALRTLDDIGDQDLLPLLGKELIVILIFLDGHGVGNALLFICRKEDPLSMLCRKLRQSVFVQPVVDVADIVIDAPSGNPCLPGQVF